jgi:hypothetical protein
MLIMSELPKATTEDLEKKRLECFVRSEKAIREHPVEYLKIKEMIGYVISNRIDINEYFCMACTLAKLLETMGQGTVFYEYYYKNIDPNQMGRARYFRAECGDLLEQITDLNEWRASKRKLRIVHSR